MGSHLDSKLGFTRSIIHGEKSITTYLSSEVMRIGAVQTINTYMTVKGNPVWITKYCYIRNPFDEKKDHQIRTEKEIHVFEKDEYKQAEREHKATVNFIKSLQDTMVYVR